MEGMGRPDGGGGARLSLVTVTVTAGALLVVLIGVALGLVLRSVDDMRSSMRAAQNDQAAISQARLVDNLVLDIETGQRGYLITRDQQFLRPWTTAQGHFPGQAQALVNMSTSPEQKQLAEQIAAQGESFIRDYSIPLVDAARANQPSATSLPVMIAGKQRVDGIRSLFDSYTATQQAAITAAESTADANAEDTVIVSSVGLGLSVLLIAGYVGYVTRVVAAPIRRAAGLATRLAEGELSARMPRTGSREIGRLESAFNELAGGLEASLAASEAASRRLKFLYDAGTSVGTTLDVERTARELADVAVPRFSDYATVDIDACVLEGGQPEDGEVPLRRVAKRGDGPALFRPVGALVATPPLPARPGQAGDGVAIQDLRTSRIWADRDPDQAAALLGSGVRELIVAPLTFQNMRLGRVAFWRSATSAPFGQEDRAAAGELAAKAAVAIDNARRYTRERTTALTLQRSLLPHRLPDQPAVETAYRYLPTSTQAGIGGDWLDVIPLSGTRVALVLGDVAGHGVHASATMGQLRSAVRTLADVDLAPDELLTRLDDLVIHLTEGDGTPTGELNATCVYAVYDPISRHCALASAGHPFPFVVDPAGTVAPISARPGPPLGVGGLPFEVTGLDLAEGSVLVLYSDGLVHSRDLDIGRGLARLHEALAELPPDLDAACATVMDRLLARAPADDVALLMARTRALADDHVATWEIAPDPAQVARARTLATEMLDAWQLEEASFVTELVVSELVTNAIRYGSPPIRLRLIRDEALICEVSDGSSTAPHLRRARVFDEGGRGLMLVAQLTQRWGTRYDTAGKTIWCEQTGQLP